MKENTREEMERETDYLKGVIESRSFEELWKMVKTNNVECVIETLDLEGQSFTESINSIAELALTHIKNYFNRFCQVVFSNGEDNVVLFKRGDEEFFFIWDPKSEKLIESNKSMSELIRKVSAQKHFRNFWDYYRSRSQNG